MGQKKLILHFNFMKQVLEKEPITLEDLAQKMLKEFGVDYYYVRREIDELIALKKVKRVKIDSRTLLVWTKEFVKFEYELENNVLKLDRQYTEFNVIPSKVRQMKLPLFVLSELNKKIADLSELELMLEIKAVRSNGVWYTVKRSE